MAALEKALGKGNSSKVQSKRRAMHPRNKYAENPPDFNLLASIYPSFKAHVSYGTNGRARIDWTDFNATRELTRALLAHDCGITWWIPDGQLCPTVTSRANYIHWIEDLLTLCPAPWHLNDSQNIFGIDIGTGANCIYPLLGSALHGWRFIGTDITPVALNWAEKNVRQNIHIAELIQVRNAHSDVGDPETVRSVDIGGDIGHGSAQICPAPQPLTSTTASGPLITHEKAQGVFSQGPQAGAFPQEQQLADFSPPRPYGPAHTDIVVVANSGQKNCSRALQEMCLTPVDQASSELHDICRQPSNSTDGVPSISGKDNLTHRSEPVSHDRLCSQVLVGVVKEEERFDFCMCNPPFFESMAEAGANPRTACGGTREEMVCVGGEEAFVNCIIEDSVKLRHRIHWYTTMVGRKASLKGLTAKLWSVGVATVRTTEFVQGRTSRWGLAWSFTPPPKSVSNKTPNPKKSNVSFMLEGLGRKCSAIEVLQAMALQLQACGASCTLDLASFAINGLLPVVLSELHKSDIPGSKRKRESPESFPEQLSPALSNASGTQKIGDRPSFRASVFQQAPGALLIKASLAKGDQHPAGNVFAELFEHVQRALKQRFSTTLRRNN